MVLLASRADPTGNERYPDAAPAAYALLEAARSDGDCEAQLNLLLLVAADDQPRDDVVAEEAQRAADSCPNDPTPGWVLGQFQSQRAWMEPSDDAPGDPVPADSQAQADATLASLVERYPESADAWRGFGDVRLRAGLRTVEDQPFTARNALQTAVAYYRHADELSGSTESAPGLARALIGLGEPEKAASVLDGEIERSLAPGPQLEILTQAQEEAHDFAAASTTARDLEERGADAYPDGPALFPVPSGSGAWEIGVGADERAWFTVALQPAPGGAGGGAVVGDSSFVPVYRTSDFVETQADCPGWAWRRDAMLAGQPMAALADWPNGYAPFDEGRFPGISCGPFTDPKPMFRIEAGVDLSLTPSEMTYWTDERQNMWRWAGDLARAEDIVEAWDQATHERQALPALRLGEIQYLKERYDDAAATFGIAARRTRLAQWDDDLGVEQALLDRGASQLAAGRRDEAMALLRSLQTESLRGVSYHKKDSTPETEGLFALVGYHSSALMGDSERESGEFLAAVEDYDAASELVPVLEEAGAAGYRVERVHNNKAVTELALGRLESAEEAVRQALQVDRMNPAFLMTAAAVADAASDTASAADFNARALESDPGAYPAANNEGVQLARLGRDDDAEIAFRRSIGANPDYALGWFNLGVLQSRMGPSRLLASQGALARTDDRHQHLSHRIGPVEAIAAGMELRRRAEGIADGVRRRARLSVVRLRARASDRPRPGCGACREVARPRRRAAGENAGPWAASRPGVGARRDGAVALSAGDPASECRVFQHRGRGFGSRDTRSGGHPRARHRGVAVRRGADAGELDPGPGVWVGYGSGGSALGSTASRTPRAATVAGACGGACDAGADRGHAVRRGGVARRADHTLVGNRGADHDRVHAAAGRATRRCPPRQAWPRRQRRRRRRRYPRRPRRRVIAIADAGCRRAIHHR